VLKIWGRTTSVNVQKVMWAVAELGIAHERIDAGGAFGVVDKPEYAALNPNRLVPTIQDGEVTLWESAAIIRYLTRKYGRGTLLPEGEPQFALADQWMTWADTTLYPSLITTIFTGLIRTPATQRDERAIAAAVQRVGEKLGILDTVLAEHPYIMGDALTMADISAGALMYRYFTLPLARPSLRHVEAWYKRLAERPAYRTHVMVDYNVLRVAGA